MPANNAQGAALRATDPHENDSSMLGKDEIRRARQVATMPPEPIHRVSEPPYHKFGLVFFARIAPIIRLRVV